VQTRILTSIDQLSDCSSAWDDLWRRSESALPTAQSEPFQLWLKQFAEQKQIRVIVVEEKGQMLAAFPLIGQRLGKVIEVGAMTHNDWSTGADLMVDARADWPRIHRQLLEGMKDLSWPMLWLAGCRTELPVWRSFLGELERARHAVTGHERFRVGQVRVAPSFESLEKMWSRNHRRHMRRAVKRLQEEGGSELVVRSEFNANEIEPLLRRGFEIEHRGWKGSAGSSVLATPGMFEYFLDQSKLLAKAGNLQLVFLEYQGKPIAFEYGWYAKGTYYTPKVAYDEEFAKFTPGQLLRYRLLKKMVEESPGDVVDYMGPLRDATAKWTTDTYSVDSVLVSLRPVVGRTMVLAYRMLRSVRDLRRRGASESKNLAAFAPSTHA